MNAKIQQAPADESQTYLGSIERIVLEFDQLAHHSEVQKKHVTVVFEEIVSEFDEWVGGVAERLGSGEIVTLDIEDFQHDLTVSKISDAGDAQEY